ncbi:unnamed protein product [Prorocentrum cordatum]|uniref:Uncharacterized protein n=1 Tax=Prorocentrum cordatum TaxID=2364126 RepID=A0ABN9TJ43_9DINO|nr:unnamed protein product [Polarella glacialis]
MPNCATPGRTSCSRAASGSGPLPNSPPAPLDPRPPTAMPCPPAPLPRRARRARKGSRALGAAAALAGAAAAATAVHTSQRPSQAFISPFEGARASAAASLVAGGLALGALQPPAIAENSFASLLGGAVTESLPQTDERLKTLQSQLKKPTLSPQKLEELELPFCAHFSFSCPVRAVPAETGRTLRCEARLRVQLYRRKGCTRHAC